MDRISCSGSEATFDTLWLAQRTLLVVLFSYGAVFLFDLRFKLVSPYMTSYLEDTRGPVRSRGRSQEYTCIVVTHRKPLAILVIVPINTPLPHLIE